MGRVACLWSIQSRSWEGESRVATGVGNAFQYLTPLLEDLGHEVLNVTASHDEDGASRRLAEFQPDVLMVSALSAGVDRAERLTKRLRAHVGDLRVVWGGWHAIAVPDQVLASGADTVVLGPGENAVASAGADLSFPAGVVDFSRAQRHWTRPREMLLGEMMTPGFPLEANIGGVSAIDGCPQSCRFCASAHTKYKVRPRDLVEGEIALLLEQRAGGFFLLDGNPMAHHRAFAELCLAVKAVAGDRLPWRVFGDCASVNDESVSGFRAAGGCNIYVGLETPDPSEFESYGIQRKLGKRPIARVAETVRRNGVYLTASLIVGDPRREDNLDNILMLLDSVRPDCVALHQMMPIPGTPLWSELQPLLRDGLSFGDLDQANPDGFFHYRRRPFEMIAEVMWRYYTSDGYLQLVEERKAQLGDSYLSDIAGLRAWLSPHGIDPWARIGSRREDNMIPVPQSSMLVG
jgi:radical SAM superfamily enzyme YgiQ (UPF0313 family)